MKFWRKLCSQPKHTAWDHAAHPSTVVPLICSSSIQREVSGSNIVHLSPRDPYGSDKSQPYCCDTTADCLALSTAAFTLVVISTSTPIFVALILPLGGLYLYIQRYYLRTSRELKRLDSITRSPIYAQFQESLSGITTIRAYRQQGRFANENEWRVDANLRAYYPSTTANRWLAVRLEFIGSVIILTSAGLAIIAVSTGGGPSAGLVGLAMSYALQITQSLNWIVRQTVEVETNIVSVERVLEYARLPSEAPEVISKNRPPISWPAYGQVRFDHYSTRYRQGLDLVLKNVNIDVKSREHIGVVGRTGAGKSSLTLALFRIIEPAEGTIKIDDLDTTKIGLWDLRRRLAIIPQDAALFEGTVRDNLDPGHVHDDTELWSVLGMHQFSPLTYVEARPVLTVSQSMQDSKTM